MVSYYNPVPMFGRNGSGHSNSTTSNSYFAPPYTTYPSPHPHHVHHHHSIQSIHTPFPTNSNNPSAISPITAPSEFNINSNHQYSHQIPHLNPDPTSTVSISASVNPWTHSVTPADNCVTVNTVYNGCHRNYDEWSSNPYHNSQHPSFHHSNFYTQFSPPPRSSTLHCPHSNTNPSINNIHSDVSCTNAGGPFKIDPATITNVSQENSPQEIPAQQTGRTGTILPSSGTPSLTTPHSPDSGMAISDGVSSSGSPAIGMANLGQPHHTFTNRNNIPLHLTSPEMSLNEISIPISQQDTSSNSLNHQLLHTHHRPGQARSPYEWMKKPAFNISTHSSNGKTRTKDKYRVVYSDTQRLELEKEFHYSRYITIRRKAELASILGLSERQVKIWFQNRRAKERKIVRKREEIIHREKIATMVNSASSIELNHITSSVVCSHSNSIIVANLL